MKKLQYMTFKEIYQEFGFILDLKYVSNIFSDEEIVEEFYSKLRDISLSGVTENMFTREFFFKHAEDVNKEAFVFFSLKTMLENKRAFNLEKVEKCREVLKNSRFAYYQLDFESNEWDTIKRITGKELATGEKDKDFDNNINMARIKKLSEKIDLMNLFYVGSINDIDKCYGINPDLNILLMRMSLINALDSLKPLTDKQKREYLVTSKSNELFDLISEQKDDYYSKVDMKKFYEKMPIYLKKYPECFDIDKLLLSTAYRINSYLDTVNLDEKSSKDFSKLLLIIKDSMESKHLKLTGLKAIDPNDKEEKNYSYKDLLDVCTRITSDGEYVSSLREEELRENLIEDPSNLVNVNPEVIRIMNFTEEDYKNFYEVTGNLYYLISNNLLSKTQQRNLLCMDLSNSSDFIKLIEEGYFDKKQVDLYIKNGNIVTTNLLQVLDQKNMLDVEEKMKYYLDGTISIEALERMPHDKKQEFTNLINVKKLINLYKNDEENKNEYIKYVALFRNFVLSNKNKEEKENLAEIIIEEIGIELEDEDLVNLYKEHLIPINTVESWGGSQLITKMMRNALLKPIDVKEICNNGNYDCVLNIMKDGNIPRKNKLAIFYTTFADEDDALTEEQKVLRELAKEEALKYMNLTDKSIKSKRKSNGTRQKKEIIEHRNEYVSDPLSRWTLIKLIDEEYSYEMLDQGMMIFKLPNYNKVILEKMFKKEQPDYARATKVLDMSIEEFEKVKENLIISGDIPVQSTTYHPIVREKCTSISHGPSWGQRIAEIFDYKFDKKRSNENIEKIDKEIDKILKSRKLRGE